MHRNEGIGAGPRLRKWGGPHPSISQSRAHTHMHTNERKSHYHTQKKSPHLLKLVPHHLLILRHGGGRERGGGGEWREQREIILALSQISRRIQFCSCAIHIDAPLRIREHALVRITQITVEKTQTSARKSRAHLLPDTGPVRRNPSAVLQLNPSPLHPTAQTSLLCHVLVGGLWLICVHHSGPV